MLKFYFKIRGPSETIGHNKIKYFNEFVKICLLIRFIYIFTIKSESGIMVTL